MFKKRIQVRMSFFKVDVLSSFFENYPASLLSAQSTALQNILLKPAWPADGFFLAGWLSEPYD